MDFLTRPEELILLAVRCLKDNAYCVSIRTEVSKMTGNEWSFGAVYVPLNRLEIKGMITSWMGPSTPTRGGRSKRFYKLTPHGIKALVQVKRLNRIAWKKVPELSY
jgi:DNA-binding PadR family transcriptional regulator